MSWIPTLVAIALALLGYWQRWRRTNRRLLELASKVPGPPAWPIVGNSLLFLNPAEQLNNITELTRQYGDYVRIWLGPELNIFVKNPADIRINSEAPTPTLPSQDPLQLDEVLEVLEGDATESLKVRSNPPPTPDFKSTETPPTRESQDPLNELEVTVGDATESLKDKNKQAIDTGKQAVPAAPSTQSPQLIVISGGLKNSLTLLLTSSKVNQKGPVYDLMKKYIGPGILTGGPTWRNHRKIATPSYNKKCVQEYAAIFNTEAEELADLLSKKVPGVTIDVYKDVVMSTTQSVCQTLMGLSKEDSQNLNRLDEVVFTTQRMYSHIFNKMTKWWLHIPFVYWLVGAKKNEDYYLKTLDDLSSDIVNRRRKDLEYRGVTSEETLGIVDRYILSGELTEQEIKWETISLFTTSQEASAKIASGVLMFLAHLPDWQEKVYSEIVQILGPHDAPVSTEQLKELHHLDMVYKETLRYFSIAAMIQRTVEEEITVDNGKIILPVGTSLVIPIHDLHRDPRYWPEPYRVMPERFLPENVAKRDPNAFVPFSLGAMDCLGRVYATALIKILVVRVLRKVHLEGCGALDDLPLEVAISVKPANGFKLRVRPRRVRNGRIHA